MPGVPRSLDYCIGLATVAAHDSRIMSKRSDRSILRDNQTVYISPCNLVTGRLGHQNHPFSPPLPRGQAIRFLIRVAEVYTNALPHSDLHVYVDGKVHVFTIIRSQVQINAIQGTFIKLTGEMCCKIGRSLALPVIVIPSFPTLRARHN